jgi:hypothetical protein
VTFRDCLGRATWALEAAYHAITDTIVGAIRVALAIGAFVRGLLILGLCIAMLTGLGWLAYLAWGHPERIGLAIGVIAVPLILRFLLAGFAGGRRSQTNTDKSHLESRGNPASINFTGRR